MSNTETFNKVFLKHTYEELLVTIDNVLEENLPEGKVLSDFNGGYVQQLKNSTVFMAFFGTKAGTKTKATAKIAIPDQEVDLFHILLTAKIRSMRAADAPVKITSAADMLLAGQLKLAAEALPNKPAGKNLFE